MDTADSGSDGFVFVRSRFGETSPKFKNITETASVKQPAHFRGTKNMGYLDKFANSPCRLAGGTYC